MTRPYTDTSIFQGWLEWKNERGNEFRAEDRGSGTWSIYERNGDAFIHTAKVRIDGRATPRKLSEALDDLDDEEQAG